MRIKFNRNKIVFQRSYYKPEDYQRRDRRHVAAYLRMYDPSAHGDAPHEKKRDINEGAQISGFARQYLFPDRQTAQICDRDCRRARDIRHGAFCFRIRHFCTSAVCFCLRFPLFRSEFPDKAYRRFSVRRNGYFSTSSIALN